MIFGEFSTVHDASMYLLSYSFNGLRESSFASFQAASVEFQPPSLTCRLHTVKARHYSRVPLVRFTSTSSPSPLYLWRRWQSMPPAHPRWFVLASEPVEWRPSALHSALQRLLSAQNITAPTGGIFTSHSLRMGTHTERVLIGIPLEVDLRVLGPRSSAMAQIYFDRTIASTTHSAWVSGNALS